MVAVTEEWREGYTRGRNERTSVDGADIKVPDKMTSGAATG